MFIWPLSDALEAIMVIELISLMGKSGSKVLLPVKMVVTWAFFSKRLITTC